MVQNNTMAQRENVVQTDDVWAEYYSNADEMGWKIPSGTMAKILPDAPGELLPANPDSGESLTKPAGDAPLPPPDKNIDTAFDNPTPPPLITPAAEQISAAEDDKKAAIPAWLIVLIIIMIILMAFKK